MKNNYAVFEEIGEEVERFSIWMTKEKAIEFKKSFKQDYPDRHFVIYKKEDL